MVSCQLHVAAAAAATEVGLTPRGSSAGRLAGVHKPAQKKIRPSNDSPDTMKQQTWTRAQTTSAAALKREGGGRAGARERPTRSGGGASHARRTAPCSSRTSPTLSPSQKLKHHGQARRLSDAWGGESEGRGVDGRGWGARGDGVGRAARDRAQRARLGARTPEMLSPLGVIRRSGHHAKQRLRALRRDPLAKPAAVGDEEKLVESYMRLPRIPPPPVAQAPSPCGSR